MSVDLESIQQRFDELPYVHQSLLGYDGEADSEEPELFMSIAGEDEPLIVVRVSTNGETLVIKMNSSLFVGGFKGLVAMNGMNQQLLSASLGMCPESQRLTLSLPIPMAASLDDAGLRRALETFLVDANRVESFFTS